MTVLPAMRSLFSSFRALAGIMLVMLVLQTLLSVICIFGVQNIKNSQTVLEEFKFELAGISDAVASSEGSFITSDAFKTALSSTSILIGALVIWGICAVTVYSKVSAAASERDKYIWGMYITHGAKRRKIRALLKNELYLPFIVSTALAYPLSLHLLNEVSASHGYSYSHSVLTLLLILVLSYICIRLVVAYHSLLIRSMTPTQMLVREDTPKSVSTPRRHGRLIRGFSPFRYASESFIRMRKYYISLALIAAVPAVIWVCFYVSSTSEDAYLDTTINEFSVTLPTGADEQELLKLVENELGSIDGISGVKSSAVFDASKIYTHILLDRDYYQTVSGSPLFTSTYAAGDIKICVGGEYTDGTLGYSFSPQRGKVNIVYPYGTSEYNIPVGTVLYFAVRKDGYTQLLDASELANDLGENYQIVELTVARVISAQSSNLTAKGFSNITDTYFFLNANDYFQLTGIAPEALSSTLEADSYTYTSAQPTSGAFELTVARNEFTEGLSAGDIVKINGTLSMQLSLTGDVPLQNTSVTHTWQKDIQDAAFSAAYINSVSVTGTSVVLNVTPQLTVVVYDSIVRDGCFALGTPTIPSEYDMYFASTHDRYEITNASVALQADKITLCPSTLTTPEAHGSYVILRDGYKKDTSSYILLEELFADNSFDLVCADSTTLSALSLPLSPMASGVKVVLPASYTHLALKAGDKIRIALTLYDVSDYSADSSAQGGSYDLLSSHLESNTYEYLVLRIDEVIYLEDAERASILLSPKDFSSVIGKKAPYTSMTVFIDTDMDSADYASMREELSLWATSSLLHPTLSSTGGYLEYLLRRNSNYESSLSLVALILPLLIPFIWYYPTATLFDRRRTEIAVLAYMGKTRKKIRGAFIAEGVFAALAAFVSVLLLCLPCMWVFKTVCTLAKLPLSFEYRFISLPALLLAAAFAALCAFVSMLVCYSSTASGSIKKSKIKRRKTQNGNS